MSVAVVTPWLDHPELADDYFAAIRDGQPDEVLVVDNGSNPPLAFARVRLDENRGFSGGCNAGLAAATADIVVFLNNDVALAEHGWLDLLRDAVEPGVLAGARLRSDAHAAVDGRPMPYLDGWCLAGMRDDLLDLRGFDETLEEPSYFSDNLLCLEARAAGMTLREVPVGLIHTQGVTSEPATNPDVAAATAANRRRYEQRVREVLAATTTKGA